MAASTHAVGRATAAFQAMGPTNGGNVVSQIVHHSVTANLSANDVLQVIKVPIGAVVLDLKITMDSTDAFTYTVGDGGSAARYIASSSVSASQTSKQLWSDLSGALQTGIGHKYTANDTIDVTFTAVTATVDLDFTIYVMYLVDGQTGGITSS